MAGALFLDGFGTKYAPNQPRHPAGSPDGGQFAAQGGGAGGAFGALRAQLFDRSSRDLMILNRDYQMHPGEVDSYEKALFGRRLQEHEYADMVGAPQGSTVTFNWVSGNRVNISVTHPDFDGAQERSIYRSRLGNGELICKNEQFKLRADAPPGMGTAILERQVEGLRGLGVDKITLFAGGSPASAVYNGYYTWPRLGFNAPLPVALELSDAARLPDEFASAKDLHALFAMPGGAAWWKQNGGAHAAEFLLDPGSVSSRALDRYIQAREQQKSAQRKYSPNQPRHPAGSPVGGRFSPSGRRGVFGVGIERIASPETVRQYQGWNEVGLGPGAATVEGAVVDRNVDNVLRQNEMREAEAAAAGTGPAAPNGRDHQGRLWNNEDDRWAGPANDGDPYVENDQWQNERAIRHERDQQDVAAQQEAWRETRREWFEQDYNNPDQRDYPYVSEDYDSSYITDDLDTLRTLGFPVDDEDFDPNDLDYYEVIEALNVHNFGRSDPDWAGLVGAPNGATVRVTWESHDKATITVEHEFYDHQDRSVTFYGDKVMHNDGFTLNDDAPEGMGAMILHGQAMTARAHGFSRINVAAAGYPSNFNDDGTISGMIGFYVWPRLGFDARFDDEPGGYRVRDFAPPYNTAKTVQELFAMPGGAQYWKENGFGMNMQFDLKTSKWIDALGAYIDRKTGDSVKSWATHSFKYSANQPRHPAGSPEGGRFAPARRGLFGLGIQGEYGGIAMTLEQMRAAEAAASTGTGGGGVPDAQAHFEGIEPFPGPDEAAYWGPVSSTERYVEHPGWPTHSSMLGEQIDAQEIIRAQEAAEDEARGRQKLAAQWKQTQEELYGEHGPKPTLTVFGDVDVYKDGRYQNMTAEQLEIETFGRALTHQDYLDMVGAPNGSDVTARWQGVDYLELVTTHPYYSHAQKRTLTAEYGELEMSNDLFETHGNAPPGVGSLVLQRQAEGLDRLGISTIKTHAAGNPGNIKYGGYVGFYVWPRLGYDMDFEYGTLSETLLETIGEDAPEAFGNAYSVRDLFKIPGGRQWWKENGWEGDMYFHTGASPSGSSNGGIDVLNRYIAAVMAGEEKAWIARLKSLFTITKSYNASQPRHPSGSPQGGQWASQGGAGGRGPRGGRVRSGAQAVLLTPQEVYDDHIRNYSHIGKPSPLDEKDRNLEELIDLAVPSIDSVHKSPIPPAQKDILITPMNMFADKHTRGTITTVPIMERLGTGDYERVMTITGIQVNLNEDHNLIDGYATLVHEYGHAVDVMLFGDNKDFASDKHPALEPLMKMIEGSDGTKALAGRIGKHDGRLDEHRKQAIDRWLTYVTSRRELFARAYMQWIVTRDTTSDQARILREKIHRAEGVGDFNTQWRAYDFAPIAAEFDKLFESHGYLK